MELKNKALEGIFFKLNHGKAALDDFLKEKPVDPKSFKGYNILTKDEAKLLWKGKFARKLKK